MRNRLGLAGYPAMRIVALAETGTRGLLGAVIGGQGDRRGAAGPQAGALLGEGMLLLADRAYDAAGLLAAVAATGAHFLVRGSASRKPAVVEVLPDGSYLSQIDGLKVRIIEADLDVTGADGTRIGKLPAHHHASRLAPLPGRRADPAVPRALGATRSRLERVELAEGGPAHVGDVVPGPVRKDCSRPGVRRG